MGLMEKIVSIELNQCLLLTALIFYNLFSENCI